MSEARGPGAAERPRDGEGDPARAPSDPPPGVGDSAAQGGPARIAVVEDDAYLRRFLTVALRGRGFEVVPFGDGATACDAIERGGIDLVVSDVQLPRLDGLGLTRRLRARFRKGELPIVLCSVLDEEEDVLRGLEAGADDYLVKPFRPSELLARVVRHLGGRRAGARAPVAPLDEAAERALPQVIDGWTLVRELGRGALGAVYEARAAGPRRPGAGPLAEGARPVEAALKLLAPRLEADRADLARFFREVATLSAIADPHVVRILGAGYARGRHYLAMELLRGETLHALVRRRGPRDPAVVASIGADVARGLAAIHAVGLVHRDVKPANVVLERDGRAVLVDLGLAKRPADTNVTATSDLLGTPDYVALEVVEGQAASVASDLYALGATLYEALTDRRPAVGETPLEVFRALMRGIRPPDLDLVRPGLPPALTDLVRALMAFDPRARPAPASAVAERLRALAAPA